MPARRDGDARGSIGHLLSSTLTAAAWIGLVGVLVGGTHSALRPIQLHPEEPPPTYLPPTPAPDAASSTSAAGANASGLPQGAGATAQGATTGGGVTDPASSQDAQPRALGLEITLADAKALFASGVSFVDARNREEYLEGHVADAFWISPEQFMAGKRPQALDYLDPSQPMVIYCGGGACDASHNLAKLLQQWGYKRTHIMVDGYPKWVEAGQPTGTGAPAYETPE